jgi:3'-5' exoribonuclease
MNGRGRAAPPRAWVGEGPWPWPAASSLGGGAAIVACYSLGAVQLLRTRQDKPYVRLQLTDTHGTIEGRIWDDAERIAEWLEPGLFIGVRGRVEIFNGERQLKVEELAPLQVEPEDLALFLPRSPRDPEEMERELRALVASVRDAALRAILRRLLGPDSITGRAFRMAPAAKMNHHAYVGGLLEHTISVATLCAMLARHYGADVDRDLLVSAALLHDIGKIREIEPAPGFAYTTEGKLLGHILLGLELVGDAAVGIPMPAERLRLLQHLIASHQGRYEWQSPREPRVLEALLLHFADDIDAKTHQAQALLASVRTGWTAWDRSLGRDLLRHREAQAAPEPPERPPPSADRADPLDLFDL